MLTNLGIVYRDSGRLDEAGACYDRALALQRQHGHDDVAAITLANLLNFILIKDRITIPGLRGGRTLGKGVVGCVCSRMSL